MKTLSPQPLICTADVEATSRWYQTLLGCRSDHGGPNYERLVDENHRLILQLHRWDLAHHHGPIGDPALKPYGNGVLLWINGRMRAAVVMNTFFARNIEKKGRLVRAVSAFILLITAGVGFMFSWWLGLILLGVAVFVAIEALRGWCFLRACGIKTKL